MRATGGGKSSSPESTTCTSGAAGFFLLGCGGDDVSLSLSLSSRGTGLRLLRLAGDGAGRRGGPTQRSGSPTMRGGSRCTNGRRTYTTSTSSVSESRCVVGGAGGEDNVEVSAVVVDDVVGTRFRAGSGVARPDYLER